MMQLLNDNPMGFDRIPATTIRRRSEFFKWAAILQCSLMIAACGTAGQDRTIGQGGGTVRALATVAAQSEVVLKPSSGGSVFGDAAAAGGEAVGLWASGNSTRFVVPTDLAAGTYSLRLTARADEYQGWPDVALRQDGAQVGEITLRSETYATYELGTAALASGQTLEVVFTNDAYGNQRGADRNAVIDHLTLVPSDAVAAAPDVTETVARGSRLVVSGDGRRLQYADGTPFLYWADTGWELFHRLNRDDARRYLQTRKDQGFTVIQAVALAELEGLSVPNAQGDLPLVWRDPTRPATTAGNDPGNPEQYDYWDHVDYVVGEAEKLGLHVALLPSWGRWVNNEPIFSPASARSFGNFLAQRYRDKPVIWVLGGDRTPDAEGQRQVWRAMAEGIEAGAGGRASALLTYHPSGGKTSAQYFHDEAWLDFNMWQTGHCRNQQEAARMLSTYQRTPIKPVINAEPVYELHAICHNAGNGYADEVDVRNVAYWSTFAGGAGHAYGHRQVWLFDGHNGNRVWASALNATGAGQMRHLKTLLESRPAAGRGPDEDLVRGGFEGQRPAVALRGSGYAWVYTPDGGAVTVSLGRVGAAQLRASWFDPRTGQRSVIGTFAGTGERTFTPWSRGRGNDWVLLLEGV